jgi:hypothetical protein
MTDDARGNLDPQQRRARDAVRGLGTPSADPAFRARLKEQFVAGAVPEPKSPVATRPPARIPWFSWGTLAAAAALAWAVLGLNSLPGPELLVVHGPGTVVVDGRTIDATGPDFARVLEPGVRLQVGDETSLDILYPGSLVWRLAPGTDFVLPGRPGRWFRRTVTADLALGEVSVRTGPDFAGGRLHVVTPTGAAVVSGTLINIFHNEELSCFCLHDGTARVVVGGTDLGEIPAMKRRVVFSDDREPVIADIAPPHLEHMLSLDRERAGVFDTD